MDDRPSVGWLMRTAALRLLIVCTGWLLLGAVGYAALRYLRDAFAPEWLATLLPNWLFGALSLYRSAAFLFEAIVEFGLRRDDEVEGWVKPRPGTRRLDPECGPRSD